MRERVRRSKGGDCFMMAVKVPQEIEGAIVCHGTVTGDVIGPHVHAWVEVGAIVIDRSNGHDVTMPRSMYYALGNVCGVRRYDAREVRGFVLMEGHYGPWEELGAAPPAEPTQSRPPQSPPE